MTGGLRLVVCGGRAFPHWSAMWRVFADIEREHGPIAAIIQGGARGADEHARTWAKDRGIPVDTYPANWQQHGPAAGPIRNTRMLADSRPDAVLAFPGGPGTADCIRQAEAAGLTVWRRLWP